MKYLGCIELLNLALQLLKSGQRDQVPLSKLVEVQTLVMRCSKRATDLPLATARCNDVLMGISVAQANQAVMYLPQSMRDVLVQGIQACLSDVCAAAWEYYSQNDVPISDETMPLLRTVVAYHFAKGE